MTITFLPRRTPKSNDELLRWAQELTSGLSQEVDAIRRSIRLQPIIKTRRVHSSMGRLIDDTVGVDIALSGNWGASPSLDVAQGSGDQRGRITITAGASAVSPDPTWTLTFKDGQWPSAPFVMVARCDSAKATTEHLSWVVTATDFEVTLHATPIVSTAYIFEYQVWG